MTNVHVAKKLSIQQKNSLHAVLHGTKVVSNAKHVRWFHSLSIHSFLLIIGNSGLTLASYKDFQQDVYCKGKSLSDISHWFSLWLGCYQDKLHPHERNRKQLEGKFSKQPGGGASATPAAAAPAEEE